MSATAIWTIHCHAKGEQRSPDCHWWDFESDTQGEANRKAREAGWLVQRGLNLCPACRRDQ